VDQHPTETDPSEEPDRDWANLHANFDLGFLDRGWFAERTLENSPQNLHIPSNLLLFAADTRTFAENT
jgi:hypothetical protein